MGPGALDCVLAQLPKMSHPAVLVGLDYPDDAGVYRLDENTALIQTVDFFPPMVDDPYTFGRIAAANALSDVYAMGGRPLTAMNIVCFPAKTLDLEVLAAILAGGSEVVTGSGAALLGGHTIEDEEPKYGLAVTGIAHPDKIITNRGARPGDILVLTKPLGTGVLVTALKGEVITEEEASPAIQSMTRTNQYAGEAMLEIGVSSCTDITGFGLLGHALEMSAGSGWTLEIEAGRVPWLPKALDLARMGLVPAGAYVNQQHLKSQVEFSREVSAEERDLLVDPQTSGGLLISVDAAKVENLLDALKKRGETGWVIGRVLEGTGVGITIT